MEIQGVMKENVTKLWENIKKIRWKFEKNYKKIPKEFFFKSEIWVEILGMFEEKLNMNVWKIIRRANCDSYQRSDVYVARF